MTPKWIIHAGKTLSIGFETAAQAEVWIESQSGNPQWRTLWTLHFQTDQVFIETTERVVINFNGNDEKSSS